MAEIQLQRRFRDSPASLASNQRHGDTPSAASGGKFFARRVTKPLAARCSRRHGTLRERLNTNMPEDNDDILENHISDRQESLEVKVDAPILARLHFLTINVAGSCQYQPGHCRIRNRDQTWN